MEYEEAKQKIIKFIGISKKTEYEVINKLKRMSVNNDDIELIVNELKDFGYINDYDYVDSYIKQSKRLLKYSVFEIKQKLLQKGIKEDIIEPKVEQLYDINYENEIILHIIKSKSSFMDEVKLKKYLYNRGFKKTRLEE